ncbi:MAG: helix-turn-helix transcriptional regulator [Ruminococcaceae bacterium]|nr:helix-turn-helix transcriptional regulator [Oscillospiraceae bacterium]
MLNRIRDLREDKDLTQSDVAKATGIDQKTLSNYETGKTNPDSYVIIKLAEFFDVSADYLLGRESEDSKKINNIKKRLWDIQKELNSILNDIKNL